MLSCVARPREAAWWPALGVAVGDLWRIEAIVCCGHVWGKRQSRLQDLLCLTASKTNKKVWATRCARILGWLDKHAGLSGLPDAAGLAGWRGFDEWHDGQPDLARCVVRRMAGCKAIFGSLDHGDQADSGSVALRRAARE